jgi:hypothetical protein
MGAATIPMALPELPYAALCLFLFARQQRHLRS